MEYYGSQVRLGHSPLSREEEKSRELKSEFLMATFNLVHQQEKLSRFAFISQDGHHLLMFGVC